MEEKRKNADSRQHRGSGRPFLLPLAIALVCFIFICLLLVMGTMNLKRIDETLVIFMENKGITIIRNAQQMAERYLQELAQTQQAVFDPETQD